MSDEVAQADLVFLGGHVPVDVAEEVRAIAARDERSVAWVIRQALKHYVANYGERTAA